MEPTLRFRLLDPLRGLAAVWVFVFHYSFSDAFRNSYPILHDLFKVGDRGVVMFFVISGYCLARAARQAAQHHESPLGFVARRAWRIYPTYWCSIACILLLTGLSYGVGWRAFGIPLQWWEGCFVDYSAWDWVNFVALTRIFDSSAGVFFGRFGWVNGAYWTLAIEFQFYLVIALGLVLQRWRAVWLFLVTVCSLVPLADSHVFIVLADTGIFLPHWFPFALGLGLYALFERDLTPHRTLGRFAPWIGALVSGALTATLFVMTVRHREIPRTAFALGFACILWFGAAHELAWSASGFDRVPLIHRLGRPFVLLGGMSYSLYLMHNAISNYLLKLATLCGSGGGRRTDIVVVALTIVAAYAFYRLFEAPFLARAPSRRSRTIDHQSISAIDALGSQIAA